MTNTMIFSHPTWTWGFDCPGASIRQLYNTGVKPGAIWPYVTGSAGIVWSDDYIRDYQSYGIAVYRLNQGYGPNAPDPMDGDEFDFESGAWTLDKLIQIVIARRTRAWSTRIYCTWTNYAMIKQALSELGIGTSVWFRIADWNLSQHFAEEALHADVYAGQWASPTSNPATLVPGTSLTLAEAQADLSVVLRMSTGWQG